MEKMVYANRAKKWFPFGISCLIGNDVKMISARKITEGRANISFSDLNFPSLCKRCRFFFGSGYWIFGCWIRTRKISFSMLFIAHPSSVAHRSFFYIIFCVFINSTFRIEREKKNEEKIKIGTSSRASSILVAEEIQHQLIFLFSSFFHFKKNHRSYVNIIDKRSIICLYRFNAINRKTREWESNVCWRTANAI